MPSSLQPVNKPASQKRVLVVDDSAGMRVYLLTILSAAGFACAEAVDGAEAFDRLLRENFDVVVTDLDMPRMDGFELLSAIGHLPAGRARPGTVVISSDSGVVDRAELKLASVVLDKPSGPGQLLAAVAEACQQRP